MVRSAECCNLICTRSLSSKYGDLRRTTEQSVSTQRLFDTRRPTVRSVFTGYDNKGNRYELCPLWHKDVWVHTKALVQGYGWTAPIGPLECKELIVALFVNKILTAEFRGFRKPNTTRRAGPQRVRSHSNDASLTDDPPGYWDTDITMPVKKKSRVETCR